MRRSILVLLVAGLVLLAAGCVRAALIEPRPVDNRRDPHDGEPFEWERSPRPLVPQTTTTEAVPADDVVPLATNKDRSRFLATLLMLESLHDKPFPVRGQADAKLRKEILADEDLMQEILKLYETTQETKGQHFIKIPAKLMKKMKTKMTELLSD